MKSTDKFVLVLVASLALLLAGCGGGSSTPPPPDPGPTAGDMAIEQAQTALTDAEAGLSGATTDAAMLAAYSAIQTAADNLVTALTTHGGSPADIAAAASKRGNAAAMAANLRMKIADAQAAADKEMMAVAAKLYAGIAAQDSTAGNVAAGTAAGDELRAAAYNDAGVPSTITPATTADTRIMVGIGTDAPVALSEDKKTMVAANHGWAGKRYTRTTPAADGMYEAMVYSNVEAPKQGRKFGSADTVTDIGAYEYQLTNGALTGTPLMEVPAKVAITGVTRTAGTETFKLPDPNPNNEQIITRAGSFHGVSGTYSCDTGASRTDACTAAVAAAGGLTLSGAWTFTPGDADARVMDAADTVYASYGWWIHKSADGKTFTASAFHDAKGAPTPLVDNTLTALQGTATYMGGAAGKYALSSATGGTNDAGHFTARATLEADFGSATAAGTITGTIDNFMGADGMARDWSVELKEAAITAATPIATLDRTAPNDTVWTIGETAASASGEWSGALRNQGMDGVPKVATGTFYTEYGMGGRMVGAFGANKQ